MGLLTKLLLAPATLPARGLHEVFRQIQDAVDSELNDPDPIRRELLELQRRLDAGAIDEATYDAAEAELLARLNAIAERQRPVRLGEAASASHVRDEAQGRPGQEEDEVVVRRGGRASRRRRRHARVELSTEVVGHSGRRAGRRAGGPDAQGQFHQHGREA